MVVVGRGWEVVEIGGAPVDGARPTLELADDGRAYGSTAVNRWTGAYALDGDVLSFGPAVSTRMAGPEDAMATERAFLAALLLPLTVVADGSDGVVLAGPDGGPALVLAAAADDGAEDRDPALAP